MINSIKKLTVSYNGKIVGFLAETKNNEIAFQLVISQFSRYRNIQLS